MLEDIAGSSRAESSVTSKTRVGERVGSRVARDEQRKLAKEGYGVRVYIPFGPEWYPYFMRRLAERPANVLFLMKNFFKN